MNGFNYYQLEDVVVRVFTRLKSGGRLEGEDVQEFSQQQMVGEKISTTIQGAFNMFEGDVYGWPAENITPEEVDELYSSRKQTFFLFDDIYSESLVHIVPKEPWPEDFLVVITSREKSSGNVSTNRRRPLMGEKLSETVCLALHIPNHQWPAQNISREELDDICVSKKKFFYLSGPDYELTICIIPVDGFNHFGS